MVLTDRSLMLRMGVGAAGSSSTWGLIDPLIAGIGHRAMTPAPPPGFQSDGTTRRQESADAVSKKSQRLTSEWSYLDAIASLAN